MAKRCKQVDKMVEAMNSYLKANRVIDELQVECMTMTCMLINAGCYRGFNWFYKNENGIQSLVGSGEPAIIRAKDGYIQFY